MKFPRHQRPNAPRPARPDQSGVALVVTLLLLSVITFMAITFLVLSRGQKSSVSLATDQAVARLAADSALERAKAELIIPMMAFTNPYHYDLLVSTNYVSAPGFVPGNASFTNVNYDVLAGNRGRPGAADQLRNLANLYYSPRPPVFINSRTNSDFRYYLDLNRNGKFDPTGQLEVTNEANRAVVINGRPLTNSFTGDPQWVGGLERPDYPHSSSNKFSHRFAYLVVPAGKTLDLNYIHNQARNPNKGTMDAFGRDFLRNQGVGTWEGNLASFLHDLNTNLYAWGGLYTYDPVNGFVQGNAFADAGALLASRYGGLNYNNLASVAGLYSPTLGDLAARNDRIDTYTAGPLMTTNYVVAQDPDAVPNRTIRPWPGADNTNHFFALQELFDRTKTSQAFTNRLLTAGTNDSSYNRYTYYRLLSQLGTDSAAETPKVNINYRNVNAIGAVVPDLTTNFLPWEPTAFFTNVADRLLLNAGYNFTTTNIQVWPTNYYTPAVHQLLQLAANIYDASTTRSVRAGSNVVEFPSVFRPLFSMAGAQQNNAIYINGYEEVTNLNVLNSVPRDLNNPDDRNVRRYDLIYGVPLVVGAKKGLPNFNEFAMQTHVQVARKLQFLRRSVQDKLPYRTNQMYLLAISNVFGVEGWNSYSNPFPHNLQMRVAVDIKAVLTNELGQVINPIPNTLPRRGFFSFNTNMPVAANTWQGFRDANSATVSFKLPLSSNFMPLRHSVWHRPGAYPQLFSPVGSVGDRFDNPSLFPVPRWWLNINTQLRFILVDTDVTPNRIVDYVNLDSWEDPLDITDTLTQGGACGDPYVPDAGDGSMWCTNRFRGLADSPTYGVMNQIAIGMGLITPPGNNWNSFVMQTPPGQDRKYAIDFFRAQFGFSPLTYTSGTFNKSNDFYAPFIPVRDIYLFTGWQANDPLVHYTLGDLMDAERTNRVGFTTNFSTIANLGRMNRRYEPWGGGGNPANSSSPTLFQLAVKDPQVVRSDDWDFPTNKFANIGWLGRVHRGTPWQTIYLKSPIIDPKQWRKWTGGGYLVRNAGQINTNVVPFNTLAPDADLTQPWRDRYILDFFTTAFNDNATRGQMSINQTNLAAWSAILGGVTVLTNVLDDSVLANDAVVKPRFATRFIPPAGAYDWSITNGAGLPPVARIVNAINDVRATNIFTQPRKTFSRLGDILNVPELTVASPFLNTNSPALLTRGITEAAYERIPQQILGLLKSDSVPRFIVYSYGQTLRPADRSIVTAGPFAGLCTNYQITAEVATRAVVRVDGVPPYPLPMTPPQPLTNLNVVVESFNVLPPE
jgi:hypothetical protein